MSIPGAKVRRLRSGVVTPLLYAVGALALGTVLPRYETAFLPELAADVGVGPALAVLSAIASGMLPLTGLVFSLAFVMVQFSATAYSPRLVTWLASSATMRHALGVFTATFLYAVAALAWIDRGGTGKVPPLTVGCAVVLLLASMGFFVLLVERVAMLRISRVLAFAGDKGREVIARDYVPPGVGGAPPSGAGVALPAESQVVLHRGGPAVLEAVDVAGAVELAAREGVGISMGWAIGDTLVEGMTLLRVHGGRQPLSERRLRRLVRLGAERTFEQDPKYAIRILVDVAIKALSPAVNDPTTAVQALDQVEDLLLRLGRVDLAVGHVRDARGIVRLVRPVPTWEDFLVLAFDEIRACGMGSIQVMRRMLALLQNVREHVLPERRPALERYLVRVESGVRRAFDDVDDRRDALEPDRQGLGLSREDHD